MLLPPSPWRPLDEEEVLYPGVSEQVQDAGHMTEHLPDTLTALDFQTIRTATKLEGRDRDTNTSINETDRYTAFHVINNQTCQHTPTLTAMPL